MTTLTNEQGRELIKKMGSGRGSVIDLNEVTMMSKNKPKKKRIKSLTSKEIDERQDVLESHLNTSSTLFDLNDIDVVNGEDEFREITIILSGEPMSKQSVRFATQKYRTDGYHQCPWTGAQIKHQAGDILLIRNKYTNKVDVIMRPYQDSKYEKKEKEYKEMAYKQLPKDFKVFESEVHILKIEFIYSPLASFSKSILEGLKNKTILKYKTSKPDLLDNSTKHVLDCLTGVIWKDDNLICTGTNIIKRYGWKAGVIIKLKGK